CFFFQAEDGIRDYKVTGVQTCALPICGAQVHIRHLAPYLAERDILPNVIGLEISQKRLRVVQVHVRAELRTEALEVARRRDPREIGRASCRERVDGTSATVRFNE